MSAPATFYDDIGGHQVFAGIVSRFYASVSEDPVLRPLKHHYRDFVEWQTEFLQGPAGEADLRRLQPVACPGGGIDHTLDAAERPEIPAPMMWTVFCIR